MSKSALLLAVITSKSNKLGYLSITSNACVPIDPVHPKMAIPFVFFTSSCKPVFTIDRKSTRLNSSHVRISYAVFCLKKKKNQYIVNIYQRRENNNILPSDLS